ncbi:unnamed protein product, partial [Amoebophrya sp. A25]
STKITNQDQKENVEQHDDADANREQVFSGGPTTKQNNNINIFREDKDGNGEEKMLLNDAGHGLAD